MEGHPGVGRRVQTRRGARAVRSAPGGHPRRPAGLALQLRHTRRLQQPRQDGRQDRHRHRCQLR